MSEDNFACARGARGWGARRLGWLARLGWLDLVGSPDLVGSTWLARPSYLVGWLARAGRLKSSSRCARPPSDASAIRLRDYNANTRKVANSRLRSQTHSQKRLGEGGEAGRGRQDPLFRSCLPLFRVLASLLNPKQREARPYATLHTQGPTIAKALFMLAQYAGLEPKPLSRQTLSRQ